MKRSIRDYLLTLCVAVVIFAVVAFFLLQAAEGLMGDVVTKIGSQGDEKVTSETVTLEDSPVGGGVPVASGDETVTFLVFGEDASGESADAIFLVGINATDKKATIALIPSNTCVPEGTEDYFLGDLYGSEQTPFFKTFIAQETGIEADYYVKMTLSGLANFIDFLGGIQYSVPENMYYFDGKQNLKINLKAGSQLLSGDQAVQLVTYRGYAGGVSAREDTQIGFASALCKTFLTPDMLSRAKSVMYSLYYNVKTDFDETAMNRLGEMIFGFDEYTVVAQRIPGSVSGEYYLINTSRAIGMFENYK